MDFDRWLQRFVTAVEKVIFRIALTLVVALFIVQAMLMNGNLRQFLSKTDRAEGTPVEQDVQDVMGRRTSGGTLLDDPVQDEIAVVLKLEEPPGKACTLYLLVNNQVVGQFGEETLYVNVQPGDLLEVIGEVPGDIPATVRVVEIYGTLQAPEEGYEIQTFGERDLLAWIVP